MEFGGFRVELCMDYWYGVLGFRKGNWRVEGFIGVMGLRLFIDFKELEGVYGRC